MLTFVEVIDIPTWAINYLANGDASGLTDEEIEEVGQFLRNACPAGVVFDFGDGVFNAHHFAHYPSFGTRNRKTGRLLACEVLPTALFAPTEEGEEEQEYVGFVQTYNNKKIEMTVIQGLHFVDEYRAQEWMWWRYGKEGTVSVARKDKIEYVNLNEQKYGSKFETV